jgi:hypothetical protein
VSLLLGLTTKKIEKLGDDKHAAMLDALSSALEIDGDLLSGSISHKPSLCFRCLYEIC